MQQSWRPNLSTGIETEFSAVSGFVDNSGNVGSCGINPRKDPLDKFDRDFGNSERYTQLVYLYSVVPASEYYCAS